MNILHISDSDGAAHAAGAQVMLNQLHQELKKNDVDSRILCAKKTPGFEGSIALERTFLEKVCDSLIGKVTIRLGLNEVRNVSSFKIAHMPEVAQADLIHLHTIHSGFFSYFALPALTRKKPTVYTIHDMWAYTGHCTASIDCTRWETGCGQCPYPEVYPPIPMDNTRMEWKLKNRVYGRSSLTIVSVSPHQTGEIQRSILGRFPVHEIAHGINTDTFRPMDRQHCREVLGIPTGRKVLMFGATDLNRPGKGCDLLLEALRNIPESLRGQTTLLTFGLGGQALSDKAGMHSINLGYIENAKLPEAYSAADFFVFPSQKETFGLVMLESMACGTPVVSFKVGAAPELVRNNQTGILAESQTSGDLCKGITYLLEHDSLCQTMRPRCREVVVEEYSLERQGKRYTELYRTILTQQNS